MTTLPSFLAHLFKGSLRGRRGGGRAGPGHRRRPQRQRASLSALESLERRTVLAVTASLSTGSLLISLDAADDTAVLSSDGTTYTVTGTGLATEGVTIAVAAVNDIQVVDGAGNAANQSFTVAAGSPMVSALTVDAAIESTTIDAAIQAGVGKSLTVSSAEIMLNANVTSGGSQVYGGHVTIGNNLTVTGSAVMFAAAVDGPHSLTVNASGATTFGGVVGGATALASLTTNAGGTSSLQSVTTTGIQQYGDEATLSGSYTTTDAAFSVAGTTALSSDTTVSTGSGTITFTGTVNGAYALTVNSTSATLFSSVVGGSTPLASLTTNAGGSVTLPSVTTSGAQSYGDSVTLGGTSYTTSNASFGITGATTLAANATVSTGSGAITFASTVNGGFSLSANSTGDTLFSAAVGGSTALASLSTDSGGTTTLQSVKTSGSQQYDDDVTLSGTYATTNAAFGVTGTTTLAAATTVSTGSGGITFTGVVDGDFALVANSTGATLFAADVGSGTPLASLTTNAGGTTSLQSVTTTGGQQYGDDATLAGGYGTNDSVFQVTGTTTLAGVTTVSTGAGGITFTGTVNGAYGLTANSTAATLFSAAVGGSSALASLATDGGGTVSLKSVTTSGSQQYDDDAVSLNGTYTTSNNTFGISGITTLAAATTVSTGSGGITFTGGVDGGFALVANSTGVTLFQSDVGATKALVSLTTNAGGTTSLRSVTTTGIQQYGDDTTLSGGYTTTNAALSVAGTTALSSDTTVSTGSGAITFTGTVNGAYALTVNSTSATLFSAAVGGSAALASLSTNVGGTVSLKSVTTTGFQQYDDNATLSGNYTTTNTTFGITGATTLAGATTVATGTGAITFASTVNGGFTLSANSTGDTLFSAAVGGITALASLSTDSGGTTTLQSVKTSGSQQYDDDVTLSGTYATTNAAFGVTGITTLAAATTVSTGSGGITFTGLVDGDFALVANSTGATLFTADVGSGTPLASLTTNAGGTTSLQSVTTTGGQQYGDDVFLAGTCSTTDAGFSVVGTTQLLGDTTIATGSGAITFTGTVDGTFALAANTSGATRFSSAVGGTLLLSSLTTDVLGTVSLKSVATAGIQHYRDDVTFNGTYTTVNNDFTVDGTTTLAGATVISTGYADVTDFTLRVALAATAGQTSFPVDGGYVVGTIDVSLNGDRLVYGTDFTATDGTSITLMQAAVADDVLEYVIVDIAEFAGITFTGTVDGGYALTVQSSGATVFQADAGVSVALASLTSDAGGILDLQSVTTKGVQQYRDNAVTLKGTYTTSNAAFSVDKITVLAGDATVSTGTGAITFAGTVDGGYEFAANSTAATLFSAAVGGSTPLVSLSTNTGGTVSLKSVTTSGFQQYDDNATLNGMYTTSDSNFEVRGTATLAGVTTVATGTGNITFTGAVNGAFSLTADATGDTLFSAAVGGSSALASLKTDAGGTVSLKSVTTTGTQQYSDDATLAGTYATTNSAFSVGGITTLATNTTVSTGSGTITFTKEVDGTFALVANTTGDTFFLNDVGGGTVLASLTTNAGGTVSLKSVTTTGVQQYGDNATLIGNYTTADKAFTVAGATTLAGDTTVTTGGGSITLTGKVNGGHALVANSTAVTLFSAAVGDMSPLESLTTDAGGSVSLKSVRTSGVQDYGDNATLNGDYITTNSNFSVAGTTTLAGATTVATGTGDITYTGTVNGAFSLAASSSSATLFSAAVGGSAALASLTTDVGGTVSLQSVTTSGVQQYGDNATLNGSYKTTNSNFSVSGTTTLDASTTVSTGSGNITFTGKTDGDSTLVANSTGVTLFSADVGTVTPLASLTTNAGGTVSLKTVVTTGVQQYGDNATLSGAYTTTDSTFSVAGTTMLAGNASISTVSGAITFTGTVNGGFALTANSTGATRFVSIVGGSSGLASLTTDADGTVSLLSVTTSGAQQYGDDATLNGVYTTTNSNFVVSGTTTLAGATTVLTGSGNITFDDTVNGAFALTANSSAATLFSAMVGGVRSLASLTTDTGGTVSLQSVTTSGAQQYGDSATLDGTYTTSNKAFSVAGATTLAGDAIVSTGTGNITFSGTVDGTTRGGEALSAHATGITQFAGAVGGGTALASLVTNAGGSTAIDGGVITTTGVQTYADAVTLGASSVLTAGDDIDFKQSINGAKVLTIAAGAGDIFFRSALGGTTALAGLVLQSAATVTASSTISLDGTSKLVGGTDGLVIGAGVNAVTMTTSGSTVRNFSGAGISFSGGSTGSQLSGFTISGNGGDGIALAAGDYTGTTITAGKISLNTGNGVSLTGASGLQLLTNTITANSLSGVVVSGATADDNTIFSNSIYLNGTAGISLDQSGNDDQSSPSLVSAALIGAEGVVRVRGVMRAAAGRYRVQMFANTATDEVGFPANRSAFEGRQVLPIGSSKVPYQDVVVTNSGEAEFFADVPTAAIPSLAVGDWITSTATLLDADLPASTSAFSAGVQIGLPVLAAADNGSPSASSKVTPGARLYSIADKQVGVFLNVGATIPNTKNLPLTSVYGATFAAGFMGGMRAIAMDVDSDGYKDLLVAPGAIPTLSFTAKTPRLTANQIQIPGDVRSRIGVGTALVLTPQFPGVLSNINRTAAAVALVNGNTVITLNAAVGGSTTGGRVMVNPFGNALQKIGIFNGSPKAGLAWTSATLDVSGVFGGSYTGGFMLTTGGLTGDATGIPQVIVAPSDTTSAFNGAAVFTVAATSRGGAPVVTTTPVLQTATLAGTITGITAGSFSTPVDSSTPGAVSLAVASVSASQGKVTVFGEQASALVQQSMVNLSLSLNRGDGVMVNVFANGASLVAGDLDGDQRFELIVGAQGNGMSNFRVIPGDVLLSGNQSAVNAALVAGAGQQFASGTTGGRLAGSTTSGGRLIQYQQENLDYWFGAPLSRASAYVGSGLNAPLHIAIGDANGRGRTQLFAALGAYNSTTNSVIRFSFDKTVPSVTGRWSRKQVFQAVGAGGTSFALGSGVRFSS
jgi:hypothetical protein